MACKTIKADRARCRAYYHRNKEKMQEKAREKYAKNKDVMLAKTKAYYKENPHKKKELALQYKYGISLEDWQRMFDSQNGCCAICDKRTDDLVVDHNHESGEVRGLLCRKCNSALGFVFENEKILERMKDYLRK
jgi:peptide methionine sulfoxide reductase MsrB